MASVLDGTEDDRGFLLGDYAGRDETAEEEVGVEESKK